MFFEKKYKKIFCYWSISAIVMNQSIMPAMASCKIIKYKIKEKYYYES